MSPGEAFGIAIALGIPALFVVGDVIASIWIYYDATQRGAPHPVWWIVGSLATFPVGLIAYLVDRPRAELIPCPFCGRKVMATDRSCAYCCRDIPPQPPR